MEYFSSNSPQTHHFSKSPILEDFQYEKRASTDSADVFLSHSSQDRSAILQAVIFIRRFGVNVYIDKNDKDLPQKTSSETGEKLKSRISEHKKFIVFASEASMDSKWIPWELGIADQMKTLSNIAILPDRKNATNIEWSEREYLGLYPRIVRARFKNYEDLQWMVYDHHKNTGIELAKWLKQ